MPDFVRRLTFANVCSFLALLIALGTGSAYAANTVFSTDIVDGEVKTADLDNNAVTHRPRSATGRSRNVDLARRRGRRLEDARHLDRQRRPRQRRGQLGQRPQRVAHLG